MVQSVRCSCDLDYTQQTAVSLHFHCDRSVLLGAVLRTPPVPHTDKLQNYIQ